MGNVLLYYDPVFYAQEALIILEKQLGLAGRVHRGYDATPQQKGSTINISKPATFTVQDAPGSDQDLNPEGVSIKLDHWREVKFALNDKELTFTKEKIIQDHIAPAAYALADDIDQKLAALYKDVPFYHGTAGTTPSDIAAITGVKKVMRDNKVPFDGRTHLMINSATEDKFGQIFYNASVTGDQTTQKTGDFGVKFGLEIFTNQNSPDHTAGTLGSNGAVQGEHTAGATTVKIDVASGTYTLNKGDVVTFAGNTGKYVVQADANIGTAGTDVSIWPALTGDIADNAAVTVLGNHAVNIAFHRNAFALAMAPLSEMGKNLGAKIATITRNDITIRSRIWYVGDDSAVKVGLDVLYGVKTLDPYLAARLIG